MVYKMATAPDMILLAAGNSRRFERNKLLQKVNGASLAEHALKTAKSLLAERLVRSVTVVTQYDEILALAGTAGFCAVQNPVPDLGISHSIALGIESLPEDSCGCLICVCDQPYLPAEDLASLIAQWNRGGRRLAAFVSGGTIQNPAVFGAAYYGELLALAGDQGGKRVLLRHREELFLTAAVPGHLLDIDTREDLARKRGATPLLRKVLDEDLHRISFIGGGGKTSTIFALAKEAAERGIPVTVTTTTHMLREEGMVLKDGLLVKDADGVRFVGAPDPENPKKITRPEPFPEDGEGLLLVEADGSKGMPLKVLRSFEPALPDPQGLVIALAGMSALGQHLSACCFSFAGADRIVTEDVMAECILALPADVIVLNQCDTMGRLKGACAVRDLLHRGGKTVWIAERGVTFDGPGE
jgi:molybdenum cofactor cytidylyltransferase